MIILAVESSCDESALAVARNGREVLSDAIISQIEMHKIYGGVVPEIASRKHLEAVSLLADRAIREAGVRRSDQMCIRDRPSTLATLSKHSPAASSRLAPIKCISV